MALTLFTVFHANLAFSSIPPGDAGRVVDRTLWPLLDATSRPGVRLGLEMPADTLAIVTATDALFLAALRDAIAAGRVELVGSGLVQTILPLVPAEIGAHALRRGQDVYRALVGAAPRIAYVNEQTYSAGLPALYRDAGFEALVVEWENPASAHGWPERLRYRPAWIEGTGGARIACLWNSSVLFQRVQRWVHGEIAEEELVALLASHDDPAEARALCLYGNDVEVFDYRPGAPGIRYGEPARGEWARLATFLARLADDPRFRFALPSEVLARHPPIEPPLRLESAAAPLPAKKQAKYNASRWAVCGRTNVRTNAACHALVRRLALADALQRAGRTAAAVEEGALARHADELVRLWGSDLRTHTTDERAADAACRLGALGAALDALVARLEPAVVGRAPGLGELALFNPHPTAWSGWPIAVRVSLPPGAIRGGVHVAGGVPAQAEEVERHRDGSVRRALLVVAPVVPPLGVVRLRLEDGPAAPPPGAAAERIDTAAATVVLAPRRGAALATLAFPRLAPGPLAGTVPQGTFAPIELAADWYTGNVVLYDGAGAKRTDLEPTALVALAAPEACPIRIPVAARLAGAYGELWKTVYVYRETPRVDVRYHFTFDDARPRSLSVGILTLAPDAFDAATLRYATVNGGRDVETFALAGRRVALHEPVSSAVSARGCLGATEGWIDVGDDAKGVALAWDPTTLSAAPLVQHEPAGPRALTRLFLSLAESDETAAPFFRGETSFRVAFLGRGADMAEARRQAVAAAGGLHVVGGTAEA
jgi:hypothetical protein